MIIDAETWKERDTPTSGMVGFISWRRLVQVLAENELKDGERILSLEIDKIGLTLRMDIRSAEERGKHALVDKQV